MSLNITGASSYDQLKEKVLKSLSRTISGADSTDSESDLKATGRKKRKHSETSGYRSNSPELPERSISNDQTSLSSKSLVSNLSYATESVRLPSDTDVEQWKNLSCLWNILGLGVPHDGQLCTLFIEMNGFNIALKLLSLIASGINSHFDSLNFTQTTADVTADDNFYETKSLDTSMELLSDGKNILLSNAENVAHAVSVPKIEISDSIETSNLKKTASLDNLLSDKFNMNFFKTSSVTDNAAGESSNDPSIDIEFQHDVLQRKLNLFTSCLRICFFCAKLPDQFDIDAVDIISMLKPALSGRISSIEFAGMLHTSFFEAAIEPINDPEEGFMSLKTVLNGLQRTINSGGTATKAHSRNNSVFARSPTPVNQPNERGDFLNLGSPANYTDGLGSQHVTRDDDEDTFSDALSSDGYEGDSESASHNSTAVSADYCLLSHTPGRTYDMLDFYEHDLKFDKGTLIHPELILLSIELLSHVSDRDGADFGFSCDTDGENERTVIATDPQRAATARDDIGLAVIRALFQIAIFSNANLRKMSKRNDVASACLTHFADFLHTDNENWKDHRQVLLSLCMTLNKHHMTSKHLRLILSLLNCNNPPLQQILNYLLELVDHQSFGPNWFLNFTWMRQIQLEGSDATDSDTDDEITGQKEADRTPHRSLTVWEVAPLRMPLESRIPWPPVGGGITISLWLKVSLNDNEHTSTVNCSNWAEGHVIVVEADQGVSAQSSPYIHLLSIGSKQTMLQVWLENTTLIFRVCVDPNDGKPVGLLAQTECSNFLNMNEWQHLTITFTESRMPDKTILGKVHLIVNCFIEHDVVLEFNVPPIPKTTLSSWRQSSAISLNMQATTFFLGHCDHCTVTNSSSASTSSTVSVGNVMLFNQPHPSCQSAFMLEQLGPNATGLTECLSDASSKTIQDDFMKNYRVRFGSDPLLSVAPERPSSGPSLRLFRLIPQALSNDTIPHEILMGEAQPNIKSLQESLIMSFNAAEPSIFYVYGVNPTATPTRRRMLFRRAPADPVSSSVNFDPLTQRGHKMKVQRPYKDKTYPVLCAGLNRSLNQVGGVMVFLLLYPKVVEHLSTQNISSDRAEKLQIIALTSLLKLRASSTERRNEFSTAGVASMLHKVMTKEECVVGFPTLQLLFNTACSEEVILNVDDGNGGIVYQVNPETSAVVHDFEILKMFLLDWKIWYKAKNTDGKADFSVWLLLLQSLESLTGDDHPYQWFNSKILLRAAIIHRLLEGIQEMVNDGVHPLPGRDVTMMMVEVIRGVMGSPPDIAIINTLSNFVIAVHPPTGTFVSHSTSNFFFSLSNSHFLKSKSKHSRSLELNKLEDETESTSESQTPARHKSLSALQQSSVSRTVNGHPPAPLKSLMSTPSVINNDSSDTSTTDENVPATPVPDIIFEDDPTPSNKPCETTYQRSLSDRHTLTPIKEDVQKSPRPKSLDVPSVSTHVVDTNDEVHVEVTSEGHISMGLHSQVSETPSSTFTGLDSWENLPHHLEAEDGDYELSEDDGLCGLVTEILNILFISVMTMRDVDIPIVLGDSLNSEMLVVLSNHSSPDIRTAVIRLLAAYFSRCSSEEQAQFLKKKGFHLVANQLHQHVTTYPIAEACFYFLLGQPVGIEETLPVDGTGPGSMSFSHDLFSNHAVIVLLAILKKSFSNGPELCYHLLSRLNELFEFVGPIADLMLDNGLTLALSNLLNAINLHSKQYLRPSEKQLLYDAVEDFMGSIAIKSCLTSGSGHFEVLEDLVILIHTVEKKAAKVFGENSCEVNAVKSLIHNLFLRILDSIKLSSCGKTIPSKRKHSVDLPSLSPKSMARSSGSSGAELPKVIPGASLFTGLISTPDSPLSDTSSSMKSNVFLPAATIGHQRSRSMGAGNDMFYVPSPYLSRGSNLTPHSIPGPLTENRGSSFRPRTSALRSRSFKGSQRRRINETETANRLQRVVAITVDFIIFMDQQNGTEQNSNKWKNFAPVSSPTHLFLPTDDISDVNEATSPQSLQDERSFAQLTFDMLLEWLFSLLDATETHRRRSSTSQSTYSWERILNIAQNVIAEQITRLMVHFLSPWQVDLKIRTYPLKIVNHQKCETLLTNLLPQSSIDGQKVAVYLQYLLLCYKQQLSKQEKHDGKKLLKIISRIGHRVSSQHRRAIQDTNSEQEASIPDPLTEYQDKFDRERRQHRLEWNKSNICQFQLLVNRTSRLAEHVSRHAMDMTQQVVLQQNSERKKMISRMKDVISNDLNIRKKWTMLLEQLAHERAIWYNPEQYPKSWQLDPTEGPFRERRRLQRCHIGIDKRFLLSTASDNMKKRGRPVSMNDGNNQSHLTSFAVTHKRPLAFLFEDDSHSSDSITIRTRLQTNERISMVQSCTNVTAACETSGEILIGENNMYFVGDKAIVDPSLTQAIFGEREILSLSWLHRDVAEYHKRWWQLRDTAIEIFLINGKTYLLAFKNIKERDLIYDEFSKLDLPNLTQSDDLQAITKAWFAGRMTNFEYLTKLNKTAGRSFNDLMQYPVMPFILSDYSSQILDLEATSSYRILEKPISVQDPSREQHFRERYKFLEDDYKNCSEDERELKTPPFHYGSHYSNSGTVLHFLVRLPPFTQLFLEYQDASFDIPDRTFHSMATTYRLSSYASTTDVKELIPEFFFLPEFLCNLEGFDFGLRQCGIRVHHVTLPLWCREDPRLFVLIHRQALESDYVTSHLHQWVDLVFGFKQMGQAALDAVNVFHPATYFGMDISSVDEPVKRRALETMVKTYGQTPKMLFNNPHPARSIEGENTRNGDAVTSQSSKNSASGLGEMLPTSILGSLRGNADGKTYRRFRNSKVPRPIPSVKGLQWGEYLGSPSAPDPTIFLHKLVSSPIGRLVPLQTNDVCALAPNMSLLVVYTREKKSNSDKPIDISWSALITFDKSDDSIRLKLKHNIPGINLARFSSDNHITCCVATPDCRSIIFGSSSGTIIAQRCNPSPEKGCDVELLPSTALYCHTSEVTCLSVCGTFRVFVSGSVDGTAAIWDLDSLSYVRSLTGHAGVVRSLAVSETSGDICTVCDSGNDNGSHIRLWTINGSLVAAQDCRYNVRCVAFSNAAEGVSVNVVAGGLENGTIRMWSSWDLTHVRDITTQSVHQPIVSIAFTHNSMVLYAATDGGLLVGWCRKDKEKEKQPLLITFLDAKTSPMT